MSFSRFLSVRPELNRPSPCIRHVLYEYDGPKLVLAVDEHERQVIGVVVDESFEEGVTRWVFAPAAPADVVALLEGGTGLRELFTKGTVRIFDLGPKDPTLWELDGASLADEYLPDADATLPELTPAAREQLLSEQRRLANEQQRPTWADALTNVFIALRKQEPKPLLPLLIAMSGTAVTEAELAAFVRGADENESALTQGRMALAKWDNQDVYVDASGNPTIARTKERRAAIYANLALSEEVEAAFTERVDVPEVPAIVISKTFEPWYAEERKRRTSVYWDDYEKYLRDVKKWPASSISSLDETTTEVIERLSRPTRPEAKQTKGLVVGYVQSGKTANFTGVVAKAIDAGYRLIIVLTGTIEILRSQTQRRMDMELMGVENILAGQDQTDPVVAKELDYQQDDDWKVGRFVRHGAALEQPGVVEIARVTSHHSDYKRLPQAMTKLKFARKNKQKPLNDEDNLFHSGAYVAVIKKNSAPLKKLIQDLKPLKNDLAELPVLIIDDESDQASVDTTNPAKWKKSSAENRKRTTINQLITEILKICPRAQYVGYTATPFANVFVDPDDERDLFPADFVLSLHRPPGYMGVQEFHDVGKRWDDEEQSVANSNEKAHVRPLVGDADTNPDSRTEELQEALDAWVLSGAIKKFREVKDSLTYRYRHHTMLVHESVKKDDHSEAADDVRALWREAKFNSSEGFARLQKLYSEDFLPVMKARANGAPIPSSFDELKPFIGTALAEIGIDADPVLIVNSDKEIQTQQKKLDFEAAKVWRILVGGTQLSRGFTVEGLTISYFRRKAGQADTLMQAGRWFGFRPGYQDLVRLYIRRDFKVDLYAAFEALLMDEEAFRDELSKYAGFDENGMPMLEPRQIPPLVSQHLPWLKPTARNKMWNAVIANKAPTGIQDLYGLPVRGSDENRKNFENVVIPLLGHATSEVMLPYELDGKSALQQRARVGLFGAEQFLKLFEKLYWHPEYEANIKPLRGFIQKATDDKKIIDWAVVWTWPNTEGRLVDIPELGGAVSVVRRKRRVGRIDFIGSDRKHRAAAMPITLGKTVAPLGESPTRGVVLVSIVPDREPDEVTTPIKREELVGLISIAVPVKAAPRSNLIQWTVINSAKPDDVVVDQSKE
ncbi:Z1 domain-containing protein [Sorangium sp. So ce448]|uniref:Z1 domain-containing protein n=1 Tax=Sorangium sp. So ce448 TaxID=3133314 RepID=UPI003F62F6F7